jgi:hypothetical protein
LISNYIETIRYIKLQMWIRLLYQKCYLCGIQKLYVSSIFKQQIWVALLLGILATSVASSTSVTFGHNFSTDESASFIGVVDLIKTQAQLVQDNIASNNMTLASEHANDASALLTDDVTSELAERNQRIANELNTTLTDLKTAADNGTNVDQIVSDLDGILDEALTARIDPGVLTNSTVNALVLTEILDGVLSGYGNAYAVGFDMTNMSMMMGHDGSHSMDMGMDMGASNMSMDGMKQGMQPMMGEMKMGLEKGNASSSMQMDMMGSDQGSELVNLADYQTAQALAVRAQELFNSQLSNASSNTQALSDIGSALQELVSTIDSKGTPMDVMMVVHTKIHPNLIAAFHLQLTS